MDYKKEIVKLLKSPIKNVSNLFTYKKTTKYKKILVLGGFGYQNVGDEAMLSETLKFLKQEFPEHMIKVLTPNQQQTHLQHGNCLVGDAPRTAFYNQGQSYLYNVTLYDKKRGLLFNIVNSILKLQFLAVSFWIYFNTFLVRAGLPPLLLNAKKSALLQEVKTADLVYYVGGGCLTGSTLTRLWDEIFFTRISKSFDVPVVFSGQQVGIWKTGLNKALAKWGLSKANVITVRDPIDSLNELKGLGIEGENAFVAGDDALFCDKIEDSNEVDNILKQSGIKDPAQFNNYVALNIHNWGIRKEDEKNELLGKIHLITQTILNKNNFKVLLIPTDPSDEETFEQYIAKYNPRNVYLFKYDYDFRKVRSVISRAKLCITMRHHPLIFSVGEKTPVISLVSQEYFSHKNTGALKLVGLENYSVSIAKDDFPEKLSSLMEDILENEDAVIESIEKGFINIKEKKLKFRGLVKNILHNS